MFNWQGFEGQVPFTDLLGYVPSDTTLPPPPTQAPTQQRIPGELGDIAAKGVNRIDQPPKIDVQHPR